MLAKDIHQILQIEFEICIFLSFQTPSFFQWLKVLVLTKASKQERWEE